MVGLEADRVVAITANVQDIHAEILDLLRVQYDVEKVGAKLADFASLDSDEFVREVAKRRPKKGARLSPAGLNELRALYESEVPGILEKRARILSHERAIAEAVHAAFGLTQEDLALLRATQPPRMPPGW